MSFMMSLSLPDRWAATHLAMHLRTNCDTYIGASEHNQISSKATRIFSKSAFQVMWDIFRPKRPGTCIPCASFTDHDYHSHCSGYCILHCRGTRNVSSLIMCWISASFSGPNPRATRQKKGNGCNSILCNKAVSYYDRPLWALVARWG